ncbi:MAG: MATE family efflux transporter [Christensenellales bacterium]|jgi:putative MATE family efflux protein
MQNLIARSLGVYKRDSASYKRVFSLALPILLQNLISSSMTMVGMAMIGSLGQTELSGLTLANSLFFVSTLFVFGIQSGGSVLMAQYWGKRDTGMINRIMGLSSFFAGAITFVFALAVTIFPHQIMSITSDNPALVDVAARYGRIVAFSFFLNSLTMVQVGAQRSAENPRFGMIVLSLSMGVNVFLNWVFIYGKLGVAAMGVEGSALATLIARIFELGIAVVYVVLGKKRIPFEPRAFFLPGKKAVKQFLQYAAPVVLNETLWGLGMSLYPIIYGHMITASDNVAAYSVTGNLDKILTVGIYAIANAAAIIIGNKSGMGASKKELYETGKWLHALAFATSAAASLMLASLAFFGSEKFLFKIFDLTPNAQRITINMMYTMSVVYLFKCFNATNLVGILRGSGDVKTVMLIDVLALYLFSLPAAVIAALVVKADMTVVYIWISLGDAIKMLIGMKRFTGKNWIRNVTVDISA